MGFKMKYGKNKKFPFKKLDDIKTQDFIGKNVKKIMREGGPDADQKAQDFIDEHSDLATKYTISKKSNTVTAQPRVSHGGEKMETHRMMNPDKDVESYSDRVRFRNGSDAESKLIDESSTWRGDDPDEYMYSTVTDPQGRKKKITGRHEGGYRKL